MVNLHKYYFEMVQENILVLFKGYVTPDLLSAILEIAEQKLEELGEAKRIQKKVYNVLVEAFQNAYNHVDEIQNQLYKNSVILSVGRDEDFYYVMTGNCMYANRAPKLKSNIEEINGLSKEELKERYMNVMANEGFSDKGGAGLGLMDLIRKSGKPLEYNFTPINQEYTYFSLCIKIPVQES